MEAKSAGVKILPASKSPSKEEREAEEKAEADARIKQRLAEIEYKNKETEQTKQDEIENEEWIQAWTQIIEEDETSEVRIEKMQKLWEDLHSEQTPKQILEGFAHWNAREWMYSRIDSELNQETSNVQGIVNRCQQVNRECIKQIQEVNESKEKMQKEQKEWRDNKENEFQKSTADILSKMN